MVLAVSRDRALSLAEFLALPETQPASEYINGRIYQKPMPQTKHCAIQAELTTVINAVLRKVKIGRAFPELRCVIDGRVLVPDVAILRWDNLPRDPDGMVADQITHPPDWMVEILSPEQSVMRVLEKLQFCLDRGTEMAWFIDPQELDPQELSVLTAQAQQSSRIFSRIFTELGDRLPVPAFAQGVELTIGDLQGFLLD